jgi:hypothetical protein
MPTRAGGGGTFRTTPGAPPQNRKQLQGYVRLRAVSDIARMNTVSVRERWRHDSSLATYAYSVVLASYCLGVILALLYRDFDQANAHSGWRC